MVGRADLVDRVVARADGVSREPVAQVLDALLREVTAALAAGERVTLTGFGTFEPVARPARRARHPRTGAVLDVAASTAARFRPGAGLRAALTGRVADGAPGAPGGPVPPVDDLRGRSGSDAPPTVEPSKGDPGTGKSGKGRPATRERAKVIPAEPGPTKAKPTAGDHPTGGPAEERPTKGKPGKGKPAKGKPAKVDRPKEKSAKGRPAKGEAPGARRKGTDPGTADPSTRSAARVKKSRTKR